MNVPLDYRSKTNIVYSHEIAICESKQMFHNFTLSPLSLFSFRNDCEEEKNTRTHTHTHTASKQQERTS